MLSEEVLNVFTSRLSASWLSLCDGKLVSHIARLSGIELDNNSLVCFIPGKFAQRLKPYLVTGRDIAVVSVCPLSFKSYQLKAVIETVNQGTAGQIAYQQESLKSFAEHMRFRDLPAEQLYKVYADDTFTMIQAKIITAFNQSPKEGSGNHIQSYE